MKVRSHTRPKPRWHIIVGFGEANEALTLCGRRVMIQISARPQRPAQPCPQCERLFKGGQ